MPVKAKPFGCSQKALAALTALPLHADLKVAMAKGRQPYRLASGGAQAQRLELRQPEKAVFVSLKTRFIYPLETARNLYFPENKKRRPVRQPQTQQSFMVMTSDSTFNIFGNLPNEIPEEIFQTLVLTQHVRIERILSKGHTSEDGFWYDQEQAEWVVVLKGKARIELEDKSVELGAGDCLNIEAHRKHRVAWTTPDEETIWLAIFYAGGKGVEPSPP